MRKPKANNTPKQNQESNTEHGKPQPDWWIDLIGKGRGATQTGWQQLYSEVDKFHRQREFQVLTDPEDIVQQWLKLPRKPSDIQRFGISLIRDTLLGDSQTNRIGAKLNDQGKWEIIDKEWLRYSSLDWEGSFNRKTGETIMLPQPAQGRWLIPTIVPDIPGIPPPPPEGRDVPGGEPIVPDGDPKILCKYGLCEVDLTEPKEPEIDLPCLLAQAAMGKSLKEAERICRKESKGVRLRG